MNAWWDAVHFLRPHWLWALLALPALWLLWRFRQRRENVWRGVVDAHLLPHLVEQGGKAARGGAWLGALGFLLAVLALAGPSWRQSEQALWQSQSPLVIALDLSSSMAASDLPPSRLLQARAKLATLLRERSGGQVALVAYAGEAFTVAPLTDDADNLALFLDALEPEVMPVDGQAADKAIAWSVRLLEQGGFERGDILLLTDHADAQASAAAAQAQTAGYRVSTLGLGTAAGAPYRDRDGRIVQARLQAASLRALASAGGGGYQSLAKDDADLRALGVLQARDDDATAARGKKGLTWEDGGYWLLPPLMLLALLAFRRGGAFAVVALCVLSPLAIPGTAHAAENTWWQRSDQLQHARMEQGAQQYRKQDYAGAAKSFAGIDSADGWYNRGNVLAKQGDYDKAIAAYDEALKRQPGMEDAIANRQAVEAARKRQQQGGGKQDQNQKQEQNPQGNGSGKGDSDAQAKQRQPPGPAPKDSAGQASEPGKPSPSSTPPATGKPGTSPPPAAEPQKPQDAKAQQAADQAQRQRMQQAMAKANATQSGGKAGNPAPVAPAAETAEQRERRQAVEAWLRRVPDDPGGLLKAKFQLEHERRQKEGP